MCIIYSFILLKCFVQKSNQDDAGSVFYWYPYLYQYKLVVSYYKYLNLLVTFLSNCRIFPVIESASVHYKNAAWFKSKVANKTTELGYLLQYKYVIKYIIMHKWTFFNLLIIDLNNHFYIPILVSTCSPLFQTSSFSFQYQRTFDRNNYTWISVLKRY